MTDTDKNLLPVWKDGWLVWGVLAVIGLLLGFMFFDSLKEMVRVWDTREEYGYGYIIPFLTVFLIWQKKDELEQIEFNGSWYGAVLVALGVIAFYLGSLSSLYIIMQYAFLLVVLGMALSFTGARGFRSIFVPLLFLVFMIPLPVFLYNSVSGALQLISSELGVAVIRIFGISVYLEGNVIDLGTYKLQVVEACSGLRYLFPLASLAFISVYFYKAAFWKKAVIFLSSVPITIFMNSLRIGIIGVLVEHWGPDQAEGFLHFFEGWIIFMACIAILVGEMWLLSKIGKEKRPFRDVFGFELPAHAPEDADINYRYIPVSLIVDVVMLAASAAGGSMLEQRDEIIPSRADFKEFPLEIGEWKGQIGSLDSITLDALKLDDYVIGDYRNSGGNVINFYVAYYGSQRSGASVHSPRSCLPGGGWLITDHTVVPVEGANISGKPLVLNRVVI
ncbi:MAG: VPLPA-CTERM-specific exosortase XrtD, partial [Deltaproteobacteria bacterium]|nr:VPLPA-CTERM-specific exosortase XrtD [Deltaproteobacteria bacterium]